MRPYVYVLWALLAISGCATTYSRTTAVTVTIGPYDQTDALSHQSRIQERLNRSDSKIFLFAPGNYYLTDPAGLRPRKGVTLLMEGATFILSEKITEDGQAFLLDGVSDLSIQGGSIIGARDAWAPGTNVAGIRVTGTSSNIRIDGLCCKDLSSNAIGIFGGEDDQVIRDVHLTNVTGINCCNTYIDYLQPNKGPIPGSNREDQGTVAFYHVDGWSVDRCRFEGSQSDGTHFYHCMNGRFTNNRVSGSTMGGYFLEGCENVIAANNLIDGNGSRGVTIERDSLNCTLSDNIIRHSGREGLWMPDVCAISVTGNLFIENGRKDHGELDCEIRLDDTEEYAVTTGAIRIDGNIFQTSAHQTAAIYTGGEIPDVVETNNSFLGEAVPQFLVGKK